MINDTDFNAMATIVAESLTKLKTQSDQIAARRWTNAVDKAWRIMRAANGESHIVRGAGYLLCTSSRQNGRIYMPDARTAQTSCQCEAHIAKQPCWHVAAARLVVRYDARMVERLENRNVA